MCLLGHFQNLIKILIGYIYKLAKDVLKRNVILFTLFIFAVKKMSCSKVEKNSVPTFKWPWSSWSSVIAWSPNYPEGKTNICLVNICIGYHYKFVSINGRFLAYNCNLDRAIAWQFGQFMQFSEVLGPCKPHP